MRCGLRPPPCLLLAIARSGTLVAPCGRSAAFPLPRFSPSLATLGHLPPGGFICLFGVCVPPFRHRLRRSLHIGTHEKRLGPFLCGVGYALRRALSEHRIERNGDPRPISIFNPITASLCAYGMCKCFMFRGTSNRKDFRFDNPRNKCTAS